MKKQLLLGALCAAVVIPSFADETGFFVAGDFGYADYPSDDAVTFAFTAGYQFNDMVEVEAGYRDFGNAKEGSATLDSSSKFINVNLGAMVSDDLKLYAILGYERIDSDVSFSGSSYEFDIDDSKGFIGAGMDYEVTPAVDFRLRVTSHYENDIKVVSGGIKYRF